MKVSSIAMQQIIEKSRGLGLWVNPKITFYWKKETEKLTGVVKPDDRSFNEVEQAIVDYYENRLEHYKTQVKYLDKYQYENAKFRLLGQALYKEINSKSLEELVTRENLPHPGPKGKEAIKEAEHIINNFSS